MPLARILVVDDDPKILSLTRPEMGTPRHPVPPRRPLSRYSARPR